MAYAGQQQIRTQTPPMFANLAYQVSRSGSTVTYSLGVGIWTTDTHGWRNNRIACEFIVNGTSLGANRTVKNQTSGAIGTTPYWPTSDASGTSSSHKASLDNPYYLYSNRTMTLDGGAESFTVAITIKETGYGTGMDGTNSWNTPSTNYGTFYWTIPVDKASYSVTVRKGTGISDITSPAWGWTGNYKTSTVTHGTTMNFNVSMSTGYHWSNWSGTFSTTTQSYNYTVYGNVDVTANGAANTYTVQYNGNGATGGSTASSSHTYNSAKNLTSNGFTRDHYTFKNWNTKADGTGTSYSNGASVSNLTATHGGTVTLYAQWTGNTYTVSYDANGGTSTPGSQSVQYPGTVNLAGAISKNNTTENGYTITYNANGGSGAPSSHTSGNRTVTWPFSKWAAGSTSGSQYSAGASYQPSSNIKMYAIWTKNVSANSSWTCSSTQPKKTGHSFLGWSESSTATSATYTAGTTYTITKGLTLYAVWRKNNYYLDVNGYLDGADNGSLTEYGTFDISVNGTSVGNDVNDYYTQHPYGSSYSITDIKANSGYQYNGVHSGTLTGTIGDNETTTGVRLNFSTKKPSNVILTGNWTSPFNVDLQWSATGLSITYAVYRIEPNGNVLKIDRGTDTSMSIGVMEETTYQFYVEATNAGGTVKSNVITITTPADQAKIRIKQEGEWVKGKTYYKQDGTWKKVKKIYIKKNGVWYVGNNYDS